MWRVRAMGTEPASVVLRVPGAAFEKSVQCGAGLRYISERRVASLLDWLHYPGESRLPVGGVAWIEVAYPAADIGVLGFSMHWLIWFLIVSSAVMLAFKKRFGVTF